MSKQSRHCGLVVFSLLLCQFAAYGLMLTGWWPYLPALLFAGLALTGSLKLCLEHKTPEIRVENHYHLYYDETSPRSRFPNNLPPSRW